MLDKRLWGIQNPLRQFTILNQETLVKLEDRNASVDRLRDMTADEIGKVIFFPRYGLNSYSYLAVKSWVAIPDHYRTTTGFNSFRQLILSHNNIV